MKTDIEKLMMDEGRFIPMPGGEPLSGRVGRVEDYLTALSGELGDLLDRISLLLRRMESRIDRAEEAIALVEESLTALQASPGASSDASASSDAGASADTATT